VRTLEKAEDAGDEVKELIGGLCDIQQSFEDEIEEINHKIAERAQEAGVDKN